MITYPQADPEVVYQQHNQSIPCYCEGCKKYREQEVELAQTKAQD